MFSAGVKGEEGSVCMLLLKVTVQLGSCLSAHPHQVQALILLKWVSSLQISGLGLSSGQGQVGQE